MVTLMEMGGLLISIAGPLGCNNIVVGGVEWDIRGVDASASVPLIGDKECLPSLLL